MQPVEIYPSRGKLLLLLVGSLAFTAGSGWLLTRPSLRDQIYAIAGLALFGLGTVHFIRKLLRPQPALRLDSEGMTDASNVAAAGRIAWSEIRGVYITTVKRQRSLAIDLHEPELLLARLPAPRRALLNANRGLTGAAVNIPESALSMKLEQVIEEMAKRHPTLRVDTTG